VQVGTAGVGVRLSGNVRTRALCAARVVRVDAHERDVLERLAALAPSEFPVGAIG
jgi:hypothetical protein